ncbi:hypothetical protein BREU_1422 [Bifidobacterium reuteri DSM 23975]|uniref:Uncharacterized protein n=1 Tax=Bifidobacterium reuteri DSM 23975 TaxID=1437610 RepID=A0A087CSJ9_9BIFI|nr:MULTISPECIES: hypothetical protein [Bifidobacterium]KFI86249.1 hypothetical protein BREU_1422 [Bifidobacterium reuteri DSM 23975]TPF91945.1 hypothetical protein BW14_10535 [Bifidobacterium sp. UTBIF-68]
MEAKEIETEAKVTTTIEGAVRTIVVEWPDGERFTLVHHADGTDTVRFGRGGQGEARRISEQAATALSFVI